VENRFLRVAVGPTIRRRPAGRVLQSWRPLHGRDRRFAGIELGFELVVNLIGAHRVRDRCRRPGVVRIDEDTIEIVSLEIDVTGSGILAEGQAVVEFMFELVLLRFLAVVVRIGVEFDIAIIQEAPRARRRLTPLGKAVDCEGGAVIWLPSEGWLQQIAIVRDIVAAFAIACEAYDAVENVVVDWSAKIKSSLLAAYRSILELDLNMTRFLARSFLTRRSEEV
jgi:hypothetical protein